MNYKNIEQDRIIKERSNSFLAYIGNAAEEDMLNEFAQWEKDLPDIEVPKEIESKILREARTLDKKQQNVRRRKNFFKFSKTAAIVVLILSVTFSVLVVSVDAFRVRVFEFLFEDKGEYTKIVPIESEENTLEIRNGIPADGQGVFYLNYLPEGYKVVETEVVGSAKIITFQDDAQEILVFSQESWNGAEMRVNNEGVESGQISINGEAGFWTSKNNETTLIWNKNNYGFILSGQINLEEMITIAENVFFIK